MTQGTQANLAARAGRWSAQNRKKAILGWLAFVIVAVFVGGSVGTNTLSQNDGGSGESGRADDAVDAHFAEKSAESVLVQSQNGTSNRSPDFRNAVDAVVTRLERTRHVRNVESPYSAGNEGALSRNGTAALVTFELPGEEAEDKVDPSLAAVAKLDEQQAGYRIEQFGDGSADKALSQAFEDDFQKAEVTSLPITLIILILAFGALLAAFVPLILAVTAVAAAIGLLGPISQVIPVAVFGIFATLSFIDMKQFGVGLAAAVLIDATLVRGVMLPAAMKLLGDWNWYMPRWLEWLPKGRGLEPRPSEA